ncbi:hypothetical protein JCM4814A_42540 [Streptomyces phaeofaciens JCM 4814]|uniref:Uncharacterized protein n=1 Tax=Streptomyces phaeofaciens TaxID=68254 RepID=A0A918M0V6_9ACTN|nr:hypothetical protein GCM10010226_77330 [Streptomyces phaeofaciens]
MSPARRRNLTGVVGPLPDGVAPTDGVALPDGAAPTDGVAPTGKAGPLPGR